MKFILLILFLLANAPIAAQAGNTQIIAQNSSQCMTVQYASNAIGQLIIQYACYFQSNEIFDVEPDSSGYYTIKAMNSGLCVDIQDGETANGAAAVQNPCTDSSSQQFTMRVVASGMYQIVGRASNRCLTVQYASGQQGEPIILYDCILQENETWALNVPAGSVGKAAGAAKAMSVGLFYLSGSALTSAVADLQSLGTKWVRVDFPWNDIEATQGVYNTAAWDAVVQALSGTGIQILGIIDYTPAWANGGAPNQFYPPTSMANYAAYASYLAKRYAPMGVHTWEIWNEENGSTFWQPAPNPAVYESMLAAAYPAIHKADPSAFVVLGGMGTFANDGTNYNAVTFLTDIYADGGGKYFDAVGMHPYTYPSMPGAYGDNWTQMYQTSPSLRSVMQANGDTTKKIWMTEFGYPTDTAVNSALTEAGQAQYLQLGYKMQAGYSWAGPLFWYTYQDSGTDTTNSQDWFGMVRYNGSQKPSYAIYKGAK